MKTSQMKKALSILLVSAVMMSLAACGAGKPEDKVAAYFSAMQKLDFNTMDACELPTAPNETTTTAAGTDSEKDPFAESFQAYIQANAGKLTYKIAGVESEKDNATVTVDCRYVDGSDLYEAVMKEFARKSLAGIFTGWDRSAEETSQMVSDILKEKISETPETFSDVTLKIKCVKQDGKWYISETGDELENVLTCNFETFCRKMENDDGSMFGFGSSSDIFSGILNDVLESVFKLFDKYL